MSDEIEVRKESTEVAVPDFAAGSDLVLWAYEARQAHQMALSLCKTTFVPASMRGKPEDVAAAIMAGRELGLKPMATLKSLDVIQGTPALRAHAMRGLVQSHGHQIEVVESSRDHVLMRGRRKLGLQFGAWQESLWTIERAKQMGLTDKPEWKKQPQTMLTARATAEICRLIAADVLHALPYAAEEIDEPYDAGVATVGERVTVDEIIANAVPATNDDMQVIPQSKLRAYSYEEAAEMEAKLAPVLIKVDEFLEDPSTGEKRKRPTARVASLRERHDPSMEEVQLPTDSAVDK